MDLTQKISLHVESNKEVESLLLVDEKIPLINKDTLRLSAYKI